ncbi:cell division protein FtsL [Buchnera aphidicola (Diuraphis noxia)]|uniref:Cell division protein FtsL n=1 Tax=Buchnera aphidicola subsp. Diuraphis noxia TaxID=118101 RepID=A0A1B2H882_BUCDN|nr:cell division protein FtsL [Buchnera aphidicola]ANZ22447.1 cell division protein FtsL [Buchnera aphidicola (Diuraphis noxia)]
MKIQRYDLIQIIKNDFLSNWKIHLILLIAILISASCTVITVYKTRLLISEEENLLRIKKKKTMNGEI